MANRVQFAFPGWSAAAAAFVCVATAARTAIGSMLVARLGIEANLPALTAISWQPLALIALWLVVGAGVWQHKKWAVGAKGAGHRFTCDGDCGTSVFFEGWGPPAVLHIADSLKRRDCGRLVGTH